MVIPTGILIGIIITGCIFLYEHEQHEKAKQIVRSSSPECLAYEANMRATIAKLRREEAAAKAAREKAAAAIKVANDATALAENARKDAEFRAFMDSL